MQRAGRPARGSLRTERCYLIPGDFGARLPAARSIRSPGPRVHRLPVDPPAGSDPAVPATAAPTSACASPNQLGGTAARRRRNRAWRNFAERSLPMRSRTLGFRPQRFRTARRGRRRLPPHRIALRLLLCNVGRLDRPHRDVRRAARPSSAIFIPPTRRWRTYLRDRRRGGDTARDAAAGHPRGPQAAASAPGDAARHARPGRVRSASTATSWASRWKQTRHLYRSGAPARRNPPKSSLLDGPPHRHRRRQPTRAGGRRAATFAVPGRPDLLGSPDPPTGEPTRRWATLFLRPLHRADQPGAHRRGGTMRSTSWRSPPLQMRQRRAQPSAAARG